MIAEGTANVSPNSSTITALGILPSQNRGSYLNAPDYQRIKIRINNHNRENIYYGFNWRDYGTGFSTSAVFYRLIAPNGSVVISARNWSNSGSGFISTYSSAVAGPNINGSNTSGYTPLNYNPNLNGDYYIEFWRGNSTTMSSADWATSPYFDVTVADTVGSTSIRNGRVHCAKWCFVAVNGSFVPDAAASSAMTYFGYTADSTVLKVTLSQGFRPIAFDVAVTRYGVSNTNNFLSDRRSVNSSASPSLDSGYRVFLNLPDTNIFIYSKQPTQAQLNTPPILGCSPNYQIRFRTFQAGDVKIILDMNGTAGYQRGTSDTIIEIFNVPVGNNTYSWNGRDGLGNLVSSSTSISLGVVLLRGRFNLPMYDAEMNDSGFKVSSVLPVVINNSTLYWDDASLTVVGSGCNTSNQQNNTTGPGIDNKFVGTVTPAHAWNGNGNPTQAIPAPAVSGNNTNTLQCDDYGNVRVINTWGWVTSATANTTAGVGCLTLTGTLWNDVNGSANNTFTNIFTTGESGANTGASLYATLIDPLTGNVLESVLINSTTGAYSMSTVPKYGTGLVIRITNTQGTVGNAPPALATLPSGWTNTSPLSRTFNTTNTNLTGMDFGIEQLPTPSTITASSRVNPGGTTSSTVAANSFGGTDPSSGQIDSLRITSFPTNATSITINGITYTSGTFPA
ncbi:MAG: hypothetical protein JNM67_06090, partial [Bacteroidetes bacterium]|nr:hypothetical protein [Bacteroidota bacterium]